MYNNTPIMIMASARAVNTKALSLLIAFATLMGATASVTEAQSVMGFEVQDGQVVFRHVFEYEGKSQEALIEEVSVLANQIPMVQDVRVDGNTITGRVEEYSIITERYLKQRGIIRSSWVPLDEKKGITYGWKLEMRDGRYRLSIDRFQFEEDSLGLTWVSEDLYRNRKKALDDRKIAMNVMTILSGYFKDTFDLNQINPAADW